MALFGKASGDAEWAFEVFLCVGIIDTFLTCFWFQNEYITYILESVVGALNVGVQKLISRVLLLTSISMTMVSQAYAEPLRSVAERGPCVCVVAEAQGFVGFSSGTVLVSTRQGMFAATPGASVMADTPLITGSDGQAEVVFKDLCIAQVPPTSLLTINAAPEGFCVAVYSEKVAPVGSGSSGVNDFGLAVVAASVGSLAALAFGLNQTQSVSLQ